MSEVLPLNEDSQVIPATTRDELGSHGETLAAAFLVENGYRIVMSNFKVPVGRSSRGAQVTGEIDIIALDGETLCFVEVKTRRSEEFTPVITAIDRRKQRQITRTAKVYRRLFGVFEMAYRFDVVTILMASGQEPRIDLIKNFWTESQFRKRSWNFEVWQDHF
ncbi:MAG TPA: YraN family protein [Pyrinomonadaceae bacterium]|nr:YraN family protein [Pyrinomonadaceae bacterium]